MEPSRCEPRPPAGAVAPDGSPVELYRRLPGTAEADLIESVVPAGASVLELGCGAGRVTNVLVARGFRVTAVDESPEMLAHVRGAETVRSRIESLDLGREFECVLLASHFVNVASRDERTELLRTCARHVAANGVVLVEAYPRAFEWVPGRTTRIYDVALRLVEAERHGDTVHATMEYETDGRSWRQPFAAELLDEPALRAALAAAGLEWGGWVDETRGWLAAR